MKNVSKACNCDCIECKVFYSCNSPLKMYDESHDFWMAQRESEENYDYWNGEE